MGDEKRPFFEKIIASLEVGFDDFHENCTPGIVSPWVVRRWDINMIVRFFQETGCSSILDIGCGFGFLSSLLAMEGLPVTGVDFSDRVVNSPFKHSLLTFAHGDANKIPHPETFDGVFISWPDRGADFLPAINRIHPRSIVYVIETSGLTGDDNGKYITDLLNEYRPVAYWDNINFKDVNSTLYKIISAGSTASLVPDVFKISHNRVILFARREMNHHKITESLQRAGKKEVKGYLWEKKIDQFYRIGEYIGGNRKILWKLRPITNEIDFLREMAYSGIIERGIML